MATTMVLGGTTLKDIAAAVADELMLDSAEVTVSQVTVTVTYSVDRHDFLDDWYDRYIAEHEADEEVPF